MKGYFTMSNKEANRITVLEKLLNKKINIDQTAKILSLSVRQVWRLKKKYHLFGPAGLVHQLRGKKSNRRINPKIINQAIKIIKEKYYDFGPTLAWEKLTENHGFTFGVETLRKTMIETGVWESKKRKKAKIHQMRKRRSCEGELIQIDGSPHAWFENRGSKCDLLGYIDDATSKIKWLEFFPSETTAAYFKATKNYLKHYGKPLAFYADKNSIFRINMSKGGISSTSDSQGLTQFGRAMKELEIKLIPAHSAQAKGRIENLFGTLQDRLVKELRLKRINNIKKANMYLPQFMEKFNHKFSVKPRSSVNIHRPLLASDNLKRILAFQNTRILSKNLTCQFENKLYQIKTKRPTYAMRHAQVLIIKDLKGQITIEYKGRKLNYATLKRQPKAKIVDTKQLNHVVDKIKAKESKKIPWKPAINHPWRRSFVYAVKN